MIIKVVRVVLLIKNETFVIVKCLPILPLLVLKDSDGFPIVSNIFL
jgi:hypothetical protein